MFRLRYAHHDGRLWLVGDGALAELTFQTPADVDNFRYRYSTARGRDEQAAVLRSIIRCVVATR